jgi:hypothetical protein
MGDTLNLKILKRRVEMLDADPKPQHSYYYSKKQALDPAKLTSLNGQT